MIERTISSENELAGTFNKFFKLKIKKIAKNIPEHNIDPASKLKEKYKDKNLNFSLKEVTEGQVRKAIRCLKPKISSGLDFVSPKILKASGDVIITPITYIINNSISSGEFPLSWKCSKVTPVFKKKLMSRCIGL